MQLLISAPNGWNLGVLVRDWRDDSRNFLHHDMPKLLFIVVGAFVLVRLLRALTTRIVKLQEKRLPPGLRAQQVRTLASVINSIGAFVIIFWSCLQTLSVFGFNLGPLLAGAGIAGLAVGFGAQTLVHDFINGFFILLENQYDIGDYVRLASVKGFVEDMSLRRTTLRDDDGTVHIVPNSEIKIVSNTTRDWSQLTLRIVTAYSEPSDRVMKLLLEVADEVRHNLVYRNDLVADIQVPGIERISNGEVEYLMLVKTRPNKQWDVGRELRRRIQASFIKNNVQAAGPGRVYVAEPGLRA